MTSRSCDRTTRGPRKHPLVGPFGAYVRSLHKTVFGCMSVDGAIDYNGANSVNVCSVVHHFWTSIKKGAAPAKQAAKQRQNQLKLRLLKKSQKTGYTATLAVTPSTQLKFEALDGELPVDDTNPEERAPELAGLFIKAPENLTVEAAPKEDIFLNASVDASQLAVKPSIKWFKGKWLELGSKSGTRFQFKETIEKEKKIYHFELKILKAIAADAGGYRCEVVSKDKCDSVSFNIDVEAAAAAAEEGGSILQSFKRTGEQKDENAGELDFSALLKKRHDISVRYVDDVDDQHQSKATFTFALLGAASATQPTMHVHNAAFCDACVVIRSYRAGISAQGKRYK
ncbi:unnamed protein product [Ranitomeya imitator]|uniref:Immunoglobulin domain-containing protein n=1 Tax=Ranitomeya imitator TaxID=111125 RepID=A0ABN9LL42_9NEOB|nr:unnamed protein product [Ranitomeya imitator]